MTSDMTLTKPDQKPGATTAGGLVHVTNVSGHRGEYQDLFGRIFGLSASAGKAGGAAMIAAKRLFFATLDDDLAGFAKVALLRAIRGRRTLGLYLRPQSCLGGTARARIKRLAMRALCAMPGVSVLSIIPFDFMPGISAVCTDWGHDPQLWDQIDVATSPDPATMAQIDGLAAGRPVLAFLGRASRIKGLPKLAAILAAQPDLAKQIAVVVAGSVDADCKADAAQLVALGATIWDRRISDAELAALYQTADLVWANYDASYDQASGIFGRAVQRGRPVVIREGAMLDRYAKLLGQPCLRLPDDPARAAVKLAEFIRRRDHAVDAQPTKTLQNWRATFIETVRSRL